ncbi:hypothetical protein QR680_001604 [Steinernema hermaphroditum]|uniref:Uncharacterized protein n=1 Tax=Steinernema hermaphroditum TaxID=289476 RepID=A0AA39LGD4_9BILA|nr:hypothetical protein QR680_001604 [Steinernema hermaphroditum]
MNLVGFFGALFATLLVCAQAFILQELPLDRSERTLRGGALHNRKLLRSVRGFSGLPRFRNSKRLDYEYFELPEYAYLR